MINGSLLLPIPTYLFVDRASLTQLIDLDECTPTLDKLAFCLGCADVLAKKLVMGCDGFVRTPIIFHAPSFW